MEWRRAQDSNPQGPCGPGAFKAPALPVRLALRRRGRRRSQNTPAAGQGPRYRPRPLRLYPRGARARPGGASGPRNRRSTSSGWPRRQRSSMSRSTTARSRSGKRIFRGCGDGPRARSSRRPGRPRASSRGSGGWWQKGRCPPSAPRSGDRPGRGTPRWGCGRRWRCRRRGCVRACKGPRAPARLYRESSLLHLCRQMNTDRLLREVETRLAGLDEAHRNEVLDAVREEIARERRRVEPELTVEAERRRRVEAETLREVLEAINRPASLDETLEEVLKQISRLVTCDSALIALLEGDGSFRVLAARGPGRDLLPGRPALPQRAHRRAAREPAPCERGRRGPATRASGHAEGLPPCAPGAACPCSWRARSIGILTFSRDRVEPFEDEELHAAKAVAFSAAAAIRKAELHDKVRRYAVLMEQLVAVDQAVFGGADPVNVARQIVSGAGRIGNYRGGFFVLQGPRGPGGAGHPGRRSSRWPKGRSAPSRWTRRRRSGCPPRPCPPSARPWASPCPQELYLVPLAQRRGPRGHARPHGPRRRERRRSAHGVVRQPGRLRLPVRGPRPRLSYTRAVLPRPASRGPSGGPMSLRARRLTLGSSPSAAGRAAPSPSRARAEAYALTGARVVTGPGAVLENATLVMRDGVIEAVGPSVAIPAGRPRDRRQGPDPHPGPDRRLLAASACPRRPRRGAARRRQPGAPRPSPGPAGARPRPAAPADA